MSKVIKEEDLKKIIDQFNESIKKVSCDIDIKTIKDALNDLAKVWETTNGKEEIDYFNKKLDEIGKEYNTIKRKIDAISRISISYESVENR